MYKITCENCGGFKSLVEFQEEKKSLRAAQYLNNAAMETSDPLLYQDALERAVSFSDELENLRQCDCEESC